MARRHLIFALLPLAFAAAAISRPAAGGDWPAWRGVRGDGIVEAGPLPDRWPEAGPRPLWRRPFGTGFSGITTAGGRLFTAYGDKDHEYCAAIDATSGSEIWRQPLGAPYFGTDPGAGPRSTPVIDEGRVYAVSSHGHLWSFDAATGKPLWNVDLQARFGARQPIFGVASSPLIHGQLLLFNASRFIVFPRSRCITGPTVADGRLFLRNEKESVALDLRSEVAAAPGEAANSAQ